MCRKIALISLDRLAFAWPLYIREHVTRCDHETILPPN